MGLESVTKISDLNSSWPLGGDDRRKGDDHLRILKVAVKSLLADLNQISIGPESLAGEAGKALIVNVGEDGFDELKAFAAASHTHSGYFVDRGDPAVSDWDQDDLTMNNAWHDLDLSAIVPAGAIAVLLLVAFLDDTLNSYLEFRKKGNSNAMNVGVVTATVINVSHQEDILVACDSNRVIEYHATEDLLSVYITVRGWWL